jgi:transcriptional regulator with XRE-family HTH domain
MSPKRSVPSLVSRFRGAYHRVAKKLGLHPSYVSRVARGERHSRQVTAALQREIQRLLHKRPLHRRKS